MTKKHNALTQSSLGERILKLLHSGPEAESLAGDLEEIRRDISLSKGPLLSPAWPLAWYVLNRWLQRFAYRTEMGWHLFALAGFLALLTAVATVCAHSIKAARADPVVSLRYE